MHILPLSEREALNAAQMCNIEASHENVAKLLDASSSYRSHVDLIKFIVRILDEVSE